MAQEKSHRLIRDLTRGERVEDVYLCTGKDLKTTRTGSMYIQLELADRSGRIGAKFWDANEGLFNAIEQDDFLRVRGTVDVYQGAKQLVLTDFRPVPEDGLNLADFLPAFEGDVGALFEEARGLLAAVTNPHLRTVIDAFLADDALMTRFRTAPAAVRYHHAYLGGLLEHTVGVMRLAKQVIERYDVLDRDLLLTGAFLHDIGKVGEMTYARAFDYTDEGNLLGHLILGLNLVERKVRDWEMARGETFPEDLLAVLCHLIISHHGEYEYGSCKLPMTAEAVALHYLDNLDAKMHAIARHIAEDPNAQRRWTEFNRMLDRRLFKGLTPPASDETPQAT
jgi:3'-5' exoribonuclease